MIKRRIVLLSPIVILFVCNVVARAAGRAWGEWWWIPTMLVYWALLAGLIASSASRFWFSSWLQPSRGSIGWRLLSLISLGLFVPVFARNIHLLHDPVIIVLWLIIAVVNPWLEEAFWRGMLIDPPFGTSGVLLAIYSTVLFAASHPLIWGVNVHALTGAPAFIGGCFTGGLWALVYTRTRSLRWPILTHAMVDLVSLTPLVFMNRAVIPG